MYSERVVVTTPTGIHARPAVLFATEAAKYASDIKVTNVTKGGDPKDAKSMIALMTGAISCGDEIEISADGSDEEAAVKALVALVQAGLGE